MFARHRSSLTILILAGGALAAQEAWLAGPVTGMVYDGQARSIRPMIGVPGAAYLGDAIAADLDLAAVAPNGRLALAASGGHLDLLRNLETGQPVWTLLEEITADRIVWNQASDAAAVYTAASGRLRLWRALDQTPEVTDLGDLSLLGGRVSSMAVDSAGSVLVGIANEDGGGLYLISSAGEPALIARMGDPSAIALTGTGRDLYVADRARQEVLEIRNYDDGTDVALFAGEALGISDPVGVTLSADGRSLIVAAGAQRSLLIYDLTSPSLSARVDLDFEPSRIERLGEGPFYLLNSRGEQSNTLEVFQAGPNPAVYFVPAQSTVAAGANSVEE